MKTVSLDARAITDSESFHAAFASAFGFPSWYGRNMDAWIDCMGSLGDPDDGLSKVKVETGGMLVLAVENASELKSRCPELWLALLEGVAFVNWRSIERGQLAVLTVSGYA